MTLMTTDGRVDYTGTGATDTYSFPFRIFQNADLEVTQADDLGNPTTLVLTTDYTVTGSGSYSGGSITLTAGNLPTDYTLTLRRVVAITQPTSIRNQAAFYAATHEDVFDRLTMIDQQQQEEIDRSFKLATSDGTTDPTLPAAQEGYVLGWVGGVLSNLSAATAQLAADLLSSVTGYGATLVAYLAPYTGAVGRLLLNKLAEDVSVTDFGAVGDGVTDDTLAFQRALNAHRRVKVPPVATSYIVKKLVPFFDGQEFFGSGWSSCIQLKTGETGETFNTNGKRVLMKDLRFYGGDDSGKSSLLMTEPTPGVPLDRSGVYMDFDLDCVMENVVIHGYGYRGIHARNATANRQGGTVISNGHVYNCFTGLNAGSNNAEYLRGNGNCYNGCQYGLVVGSGNQSHTGGIISDNYVNVLVTGTGIANNAHGSVTGALLNHATKYAIKAVDVTNGFVFIGCNIFYGEILLENSSGIIISNGIYDVVNFYFDGGGRNYIKDNFSPNTLTNNMNHDWNSHASDTMVLDNFVPGGTFSKNSIAIKGRPNYVSGDQVFEQWGEPDVLKTYGFRWSTSASNGKLKLWGLNNSVQTANPVFSVDRASGKITDMMLSLSDYANDAAASAGGIPVGGMYRNGSAIQIRVT